jgi:hypothetical protein
VAQPLPDAPPPAEAPDFDDPLFPLSPLPEPPVLRVAVLPLLPGPVRAFLDCGVFF